MFTVLRLSINMSEFMEDLYLSGGYVICLSQLYYPAYGSRIRQHHDMVHLAAGISLLQGTGCS